MNMLASFLKDETGAAAIEYTLIVALIAVAMILWVTQIGLQLREVFEMVAADLRAAHP